MMLMIKQLSKIFQKEYYWSPPSKTHWRAAATTLKLITFHPLLKSFILVPYIVQNIVIWVLLF